MTTDRELLELAARAAGLPWDQWVIDGNDSWNPLTDDGDALRLAVKLRLALVFDGLQVSASIPDGAVFEMEPLKYADPHAATRRAIVRAAAEIGKQETLK